MPGLDSKEAYLYMGGFSDDSKSNVSSIIRLFVFSGKFGLKVKEFRKVQLKSILNSSILVSDIYQTY